MMTAFSFILGVMPLIFASGVYATARNIMGMALVGGMLLATMLGIFIYPALYYLVARVGNPSPMISSGISVCRTRLSA